MKISTWHPTKLLPTGIKVHSHTYTYAQTHFHQHSHSHTHLATHKVLHVIIVLVGKSWEPRVVVPKTFVAAMWQTDWQRQLDGTQSSCRQLTVKKVKMCNVAVMQLRLVARLAMRAGKNNCRNNKEMCKSQVVRILLLVLLLFCAKYFSLWFLTPAATLFMLISCSSWQLLLPIDYHLSQFAWVKCNNSDCCSVLMCLLMSVFVVVVILKVLDKQISFKQFTSVLLTFVCLLKYLRFFS